MSASFRPDIEGLRALAVAGVVAFHFGLTGLPGGFTGVDIFFVISGYLITKHLLGEIAETGRLNLWRFYARRARRLLPASLFVILATLVAGAFILSPEEQSLYSKGAMFASAYMINLWLIRWSFDYFAADATSNPFIHFWSLSVEEQFYLAWPALLLLAAWLRPGKRSAILVIGIAGLVSFAVCAWLTTVAQPWAFYFSPLRAWEFAAGGLATMVPQKFWQDRPRLGAPLAWLGLALIAGAYLMLQRGGPLPRLDGAGAGGRHRAVAAGGSGRTARTMAPAMAPAPSWRCRRCSGSASFPTRSISGTGRSSSMRRCWCPTFPAAAAACLPGADAGAVDLHLSFHREPDPPQWLADGQCGAGAGAGRPPHRHRRRMPPMPMRGLPSTISTRSSAALPKAPRRPSTVRAAGCVLAIATVTAEALRVRRQERRALDCAVRRFACRPLVDAADRGGRRRTITRSSPGSNPPAGPRG